jgi:hypothetical protein
MPACGFVGPSLRKHWQCRHDLAHGVVNVELFAPEAEVALRGPTDFSSPSTPRNGRAILRRASDTAVDLTEVSATQGPGSWPESYTGDQVRLLATGTPIPFYFVAVCPLVPQGECVTRQERPGVHIDVGDRYM